MLEGIKRHKEKTRETPPKDQLSWSSQSHDVRQNGGRFKPKETQRDLTANVSCGPRRVRIHTNQLSRAPRQLGTFSRDGEQMVSRIQFSLLCDGGIVLA